MKRFYTTVDVGEADGGWQVALDGRTMKTVGGAQQVVPSETLARALAQEWAEQGEEIVLSRDGHAVAVIIQIGVVRLKITVRVNIYAINRSKTRQTLVRRNARQCT